jgi:lipid-A-disaccharide synthase-like uncharacterized protein
MSLAKKISKLFPWPTDVISIICVYAELQYIDTTNMQFYNTHTHSYIYEGSKYYIKNDCLFCDDIMYFQCFDFIMGVINNTMCIIVKTNYNSHGVSIYNIYNKLIAKYHFEKYVYNVLFNGRLVIEHSDRISTYNISASFKSLKLAASFKQRSKLLFASDKVIILVNANTLFICNNNCALIKSKDAKSPIVLVSYTKGQYKAYDCYGNFQVLDL